MSNASFEEISLSPAAGTCLACVMGLGAVFDWDGVIVDSRDYHEKAWERLAREEGGDLPEGHFLKGFGMRNEVIIPNILGWAVDEPEEVRRLSLRKEALYREIMVECGIEPLPGVLAFLERLREAGVPCSVASSTHRANIDAILSVIGVGGFFDAIVTGEDVSRGKPDPEVFLKAAGRIGARPHEAVVFEDALVGIEAARAAGMKVVAVATTNPREKLTGADRVVERLDELSAESLREMLDG